MPRRVGSGSSAPIPVSPSTSRPPTWSISTAPCSASTVTARSPTRGAMPVSAAARPPATSRRSMGSPWSPGRSWSRPTTAARSCRHRARPRPSARWTQTPRCRPTPHRPSRWTPPRPPTGSMRPACPRPPPSCGCSTRRCSTGRRSVRPDSSGGPRSPTPTRPSASSSWSTPRTGGIALEFDQIAEGLDREVCDDNNVRDTDNEPSCTAPFERVEGQGPTGIADIDLAYDFAGDTYDYFFDRFGRDSIDDDGFTLTNTVRYCPADIFETCPYDNAFWNGAQMTYGDGLRHRRRRRGPRARPRRDRAHQRTSSTTTSPAPSTSPCPTSSASSWTSATARATTPPACAGTWARTCRHRPDPGHGEPALVRRPRPDDQRLLHRPTATTAGCTPTAG